MNLCIVVCTAALRTIFKTIDFLRFIVNLRTKCFCGHWIRIFHFFYQHSLSSCSYLSKQILRIVLFCLYLWFPLFCLQQLIISKKIYSGQWFKSRTHISNWANHVQRIVWSFVIEALWMQVLVSKCLFTTWFSVGGQWIKDIFRAMALHNDHGGVQWILNHQKN